MSRAQGNSGQRRELVFCHQCENEWYNAGDPTGMSCPSCGSDFTEIIDNDFDPRAVESTQSDPQYQPPHQPPPPRNPFQDHNPWANAPDPDEEDIEGFGHHPQHMPGAYPGGPQSRQGQRGQPPPGGNPVFDMMQTIMGRAMGGMGPPFGGAAFPPMGAQGGMQRQGPFQPAPGQASASTTTHNGNGYTITFSSGPQGGFAMGSGRWPGGRSQQADQADMDEIMNGLFASMPGIGGARGPGGPGGPGAHAMGPLFGQFAALFDPSNARAGDAVYSQEALDRVISQLMEQNPGGTAPPPASEAAIDNLPRRKLDVDLLDENTGHAECSICMDNVDVGDEIALLPCTHWFHFDCVKAWLIEHDTCPVCRSGITPKEGAQNAPRAPNQQPMHNVHPASYLSRRESGSQQNPYMVDESPTRARRAPNPRNQQGGESSSNAGGGGGGGITDMLRGFWPGSSGAER